MELLPVFLPGEDLALFLVLVELRLVGSVDLGQPADGHAQNTCCLGPSYVCKFVGCQSRRPEPHQEQLLEQLVIFHFVADVNLLLPH